MQVKSKNFYGLFYSKYGAVLILKGATLLKVRSTISHPVIPNSVQSRAVYQCLKFHACSYHSVSPRAKQFVGKMSAENFLY